MNITKEELQRIVDDSLSKAEVVRKLGKHTNKLGYSLLDTLVTTLGVDTSNLSGTRATKLAVTKYPLVEKVCPVCKDKFTVRKGHKKEKTTCSYSCSNTFFAHKRNTPDSWKNYRTICFKFWKKECILCGFDKIVEVHHLDYNNKNNHKDNLVPVCPNHHQMIHTKQWGAQTVEEIKQKLGVWAKG